MIEYKNIDLKLGDKEIFKDFSLKISNGEKVLFTPHLARENPHS